MIQTDPPRLPQEVLSTMSDLPSAAPEEPSLPDFHDFQPQLLRESFNPSNYLADQIWLSEVRLGLGLCMEVIKE